MKQVLRAASIGFGGTLGAGAAILATSLLIGVVTRSALRRVVTEGIEQIGEYIDQAAAKMTAEAAPAEPTVDHTMHSHPATPEADAACLARATA